MKKHVLSIAGSIFCGSLTLQAQSYPQIIQYANNIGASLETQASKDSSMPTIQGTSYELAHQRKAIYPKIPFLRKKNQDEVIDPYANEM